MAEDTQGGDGGQVGQAGQQQQNIQLLIDERELRTIFSNGCRIHTTADEVILDFGFNMPNPNPQQQPGGQQQVLYKVYDRVIMSYANVKRLANSLNQLVRRYEQQFGEIGGAGAPGQGPRPVR